MLASPLPPLSPGMQRFDAATQQAAAVRTTHLSHTVQQSVHKALQQPLSTVQHWMNKLQQDVASNQASQQQLESKHSKIDQTLQQLVSNQQPPVRGTNYVESQLMHLLGGHMKPWFEAGVLLSSTPTWMLASTMCSSRTMSRISAGWMVLPSWRRMCVA
jgi:hypothetical protein